MKKSLLASFLIAGMLSTSVYATNLMQVYQQAIAHDPKFLKARASYEVAQQNVPLQIAPLLPQITLTPSLSYNNDYQKDLNAQATTGSAVGVSSFRTISRTSGFTLQLNQVIFNFSYWKNLSSARASVKSTFATYTAAIQDLIQRTTKAYFDVLQAQDELAYAESEKRALYRQYTQAKESFEVGVKTKTDVYNAEASYDSSLAQVVQAKNDLADQRENLRAITGVYYPNLSTLKRLPLVKPAPASENQWVLKAQGNSWEIKAQKFNVLEARYNIQSAEGGHLPTITGQGNYTNNFNRDVNRTGYTRVESLSGEVDLNIPIYSGGEVSATVDQNRAEYRVATADQLATYREVLNQTRQSYLGVLSGISKVKADYQAIISNRSSLDGTEEGYKVGTQTMLNVLQAQKDLYNAQREYARDRYAYIMSMVDLKQSSGTLSVSDVAKINRWLLSNNPYGAAGKKSNYHVLKPGVKKKKPHYTHKTTKTPKKHQTHKVQHSTAPHVSTKKTQPQQKTSTTQTSHVSESKQHHKTAAHLTTTSANSSTASSSSSETQTQSSNNQNQTNNNSSHTVEI